MDPKKLNQLEQKTENDVRPKLAMFEALVEEAFEIVVTENQSVKLRLVEAVALKPATTRDDVPIRKDPFSLVFKTIDPDSSVLDQRMYRVNHDSTGPLDLFLVPIGLGEYEAVFN